MRRTEDFDELLSQELKNADFARDYFLAKIDEVDGEPGLSLFEALKYVIRKMGVKEFAELVGMERQNISRIIAQDEPPKMDTLNRLLAPFKLRVRLDIEEVA